MSRVKRDGKYIRGTRKFGNKYYTKDKSFNTKSQAKKQQIKRKKYGGYARVIKEKDKYSVYYKRK